MTTALLFLRRWWKPILIVVIAIFIAIWCARSIRAYGQRQYQAARNAIIAEEAVAAAQAWLDNATRERLAAKAGADLHTTLDIALPKIEVSTSEAIQKIHTIYVTEAADPAAVCVRPAGVQIELDAARDRANAAARRDL